MRKDFINAFGLHDTLIAEQQRFVNRINQTTFRRTERDGRYETMFRRVCYEMGVNAVTEISRASEYAYRPVIPPLTTLTNDDFLKTLEVLGHLFQVNEPYRSDLTSEIRNAIQHATIDLGVEWRDGMFFPAGAKVLDEDLLIGPYEFLNEYPQEKNAFRKAVEHQLRHQYPDVLSEGYIVIEGLAKRLLNNDKTLDGNREALISRVGVSDEWKHILKYYLDYAHAVKRHASKQARSAKPHEAEAFLYLTGLLVRLIVQDLRNRPEKAT